MFIFLLDSKTTKEVTRVFQFLKSSLGLTEFKRGFQIILTDNGTEFFNPETIEFDENTGELLSRVFYCNPSASYQKGSLEKNHKYIRYVLTKPSSFDFLTQEDCNVLMSHINSVPRVILKGKTPYNTVLYFIREEQLLKLGVTFINPDDVSSSPNLLKKKSKN